MANCVHIHVCCREWHSQTLNLFNHSAWALEALELLRPSHVIASNSKGWSLMSVQLVVTVLATQCVCKILLFNYIPKHYPFAYIQMQIKTMMDYEVPH